MYTFDALFGLSAREVLYHVQQRWSQPQPKDRIFFTLLPQIPSSSFKTEIYMNLSWMLLQNFKNQNFFITFTTIQIYTTTQHSSFYTLTFFHSSNLYLS